MIHYTINEAFYTGSPWRWLTSFYLSNSVAIPQILTPTCDMVLPQLEGVDGLFLKLKATSAEQTAEQVVQRVAY